MWGETVEPLAWADMSLMPNRVEELSRWVTPASSVGRVACADTELAGPCIASGDRVLMLFVSANRGETVSEHVEQSLQPRGGARTGPSRGGQPAPVASSVPADAYRPGTAQEECAQRWARASRRCASPVARRARAVAPGSTCWIRRPARSSLRHPKRSLMTSIRQWPLLVQPSMTAVGARGPRS